MPILSRLCRQSKTALMKKLLLLASSVLLSFSYAIAGVEVADMPSDSTQAKNSAQVLEQKTKTSKARTVSKENRAASTSEKLAGKSEKSVAIEELKAAAKKNTKAKTKNKNTKKAPTVSYPTYTGGNIAIRAFIRKHLRYPEECKSERLRGRVEVTITIDWDGTPHSPKIKKSSGNKYMDAEALRVADMMPGWNAAEESDKPMGIEYTIFVNFRPGR